MEKHLWLVWRGNANSLQQSSLEGWMTIVQMVPGQTWGTEGTGHRNNLFCGLSTAVESMVQTDWSSITSTVMMVCVQPSH